MDEDRGYMEENAESVRGLWWLTLGRLAVALLLLLASALWMSDQNVRATRYFAAQGALPIFFVVLALSIFYVFALRFFAHVRRQTGVQLFTDVMLATWVVWATGDIYSPYAALYIIIIAIASIFLGSRGALAIAILCVAFFTGMGISTITGVLQPYVPIITAASSVKAIQTIGLNDIAFLVVGLLAARLADRQSRSAVRLIAATQTLADLRALHERIVESIRSGVVTTDLEGQIYTFNAAAEEITGYKATDVRGQNASIFFGEISEKIDESMRAAAMNAPSPRFEANCLMPDGLLLRLGYSIFPLFSEAGETTGHVITFQDLTEVRALEEISRRQDRLAAVGRVAAGIAHEIRNPLASMRGSIQVLQSEISSDSAQAELMEIILRESDRLNRIITDFLIYARPRQSDFVNVDLREPLHETFALLRHSPELHAAHKLEESIPHEPVMTSADASQLKQVFWNLSRNALQAMPNGGTLRAEIAHAANGRLRVTFTDTGAGMTPEQVEQLFEPFSSSTTGGTGLGLSIVYQIIRDHGGTINVRSREGHGTTISIELPGANQPTEFSPHNA
ncbi:MAG: nitrogen regulation protein NR(II) [Pyrinomonadaceae bacterium]